jgi:hypothetical protein
MDTIETTFPDGFDARSPNTLRGVGHFPSSMTRLPVYPPAKPPIHGAMPLFGRQLNPARVVCQQVEVQVVWLTFRNMDKLKPFPVLVKQMHLI